MALKNLRGEPCFTELADLIRTAADGRRLVYVPNSGNWGDALIHQGTLQFLAHFEIPFVRTWRTDFKKLVPALNSAGLHLEECVLLAGGGGAWCEHYPGSRDFVSAYGCYFAQSIVLPTTFGLGPVDGERAVTYVRRDQGQSELSVPQSRFCHDMAFFLQVDVDAPMHSHDEADYFRSGVERHPDSTAPASSFDLSAQGSAGSPIGPFFDLIARAATIRTDRMHVAIAASLLERTVELYPGSYFKSEAVFRASLEPHYPGTSMRAWA